MATLFPGQSLPERGIESDNKHHNLSFFGGEGVGQLILSTKVGKFIWSAPAHIVFTDFPVNVIMQTDGNLVLLFFFFFFFFFQLRIAPSCITLVIIKNQVPISLHDDINRKVGEDDMRRR